MKMKKFLLLILMSCAVSNVVFAQSKFYGKKVNEKKAISVQELTQKLKSKTTLEATVKAKVSSVCQAEGCWMKVEKGDGTSMMVRMKDHKFVLPKDIANRNAVFTGTATIKTTTVDMLKHYAEDEGKSKEYIDAIKEPKTDVSFEATGVVIKSN